MPVANDPGYWMTEANLRRDVILALIPIASKHGLSTGEILAISESLCKYVFGGEPVDAKEAQKRGPNRSAKARDPDPLS